MARSWTFPRRNRTALNALDEEVVALVLRLARENRRWGYLRIVGEYRKLGVIVSATTIRNVLRRHHLKPAPRRSGPSWSELVPAAQAAGTFIVRLFPRRHRDAPARLRPVLHRPPPPQGLAGRCHDQPSRAMGHPAGP